jgi:GntR family transcriptional regulator/MocR family aminotransferase
MLYIELERETRLPLSRQIFRSIRDSAVRGTLPAGTRLPSTRALAADLQVARNVVIASYEQLIAEGYAFTKNGSGTYISDGVVLSCPAPSSSASVNEPSKAASRVLVSFRTGIPDLTQIPVRKWGRIYHSASLNITPQQMDYQEPQGCEALRTVLADYLNRTRGTDIRAENLLLTNGAAQSFHLLCPLVTQGEYALVEDPVSRGLLHTLTSGGAAVRGIPVDTCGMVTSALPTQPPKLIFTTPSHQFPTGAILPASRRNELLRYARRSGAYIIEDDYDSEFRFDASPVESMQRMAPDRVVYVGSLSKTFMPALRVGYMALPDGLLQKMREEKYVSDIHSPMLEQLALTEFIESGAFAQHIQRMKKLYRRKRNHLIDCLRAVFGQNVTLSGANAGLHFVASFPGIRFDAELLERIRLAGVEITPVAAHLLEPSANSSYADALIFGYGNTPIDDMERGVQLLSSVLSSGA